MRSCNFVYRGGGSFRWEQGWANHCHRRWSSISRYMCRNIGRTGVGKMTCLIWLHIFHLSFDGVFSRELGSGERMLQASGELRYEVDNLEREVSAPVNYRGGQAVWVSICNWCGRSKFSSLFSNTQPPDVGWGLFGFDHSWGSARGRNEQESLGYSQNSKL